MAAPVIDNFDPDRIPQRDGSQNQGEYSDNMDYFAGKFPPVVDQINVSTAFINDAVIEIQGYSESAASSVTAAQGFSVSAGNSATQAANSASQAAASAASASSSPATRATSTTTMTPGYGSKSFTIVETGKNFFVDQFVTASSPDGKFFNGQVTAFDPVTGAMTVDSRAFSGMTSSSSWTIASSAPAFGQRFTNPTQSWVNLGNVSGTVNLDLRVATSFDCVLTGNTNFTVTLPDGYASADSISWALRLKQGASVYTIGYPAGTKFHQGSQAITGASATDEFVFKKLGTGDAYYRRAGNGFA